MKLNSTVAKIAANIIVPQIYKQHKNGVHAQNLLLKKIISTAQNTQFGKEHQFSKLATYQDFRQAIPIRDYEQLKSYIAKIAAGEAHVLWPGKPLYFCKSSGTTSGTKYIPLTKISIQAQINAARNSLLHYVKETGKADFFNQKLIFLQGSPVLENYQQILAGRLSGIVYHHVPKYLHKNRLPSYETNCIEDWETKVSTIATETLQENMSLISGIPPWVIMYFEKLLAISGKNTIQEIFPSFSLFAYGGVNYEPYRAKMRTLIGFDIDSVETFPASEGFISYQDSQTEEGLLLNLQGGIFYEFIKANELYDPNPSRISLAEVELNTNYALILHTTAGLWGYDLGDTIRFVSLNPYRIVVTGRVKHFISAFGEHVIGEEVEFALLQAAKKENISFTEFHVAPEVKPTEGLPYHEWFIEFENEPLDLVDFAKKIDEILQQKNSYYFDLRVGNVLQQLKIKSLPKNTFVNYMRSIGKLGGQNKVPRLANDRKLADQLIS